MAEEYMTDEAIEESDETLDNPKEESSEKTALLPISFFQGKELTPGSTCSVKVVSVDDDQVQVSYIPHKEEEASEGASVPASMEGGGDQDMMA